MSHKVFHINCCQHVYVFFPSDKQLLPVLFLKEGPAKKYLSQAATGWWVTFPRIHASGKTWYGSAKYSRADDICIAFSFYCQRLWLANGHLIKCRSKHSPMPVVSQGF